MQGKSVDEIMNLFHQTQNYITQNDIEDHDLSSVFFYTVLAMVCLFGGQWSMYAIYDIQANQSSRAARLAMTPIHKIQYLFTDFLLCMVFEMVFILIVYSYMAGVLDIAFGEHVFAILAILLAGCLSGNALGTLIGCASKANMLDAEGRLPGIKGALLADAIGTTAGACLGTSTITTFVESSSGIAEGGRTGMTAIVSGILFLLALFLSPIFLAIPSFATAPALVIVGFLMMQQVTKITWEDMTEAIPAFICIFAMPFMYSISEGIAFGVISYVVLKLVTGKNKDITPLMFVLALVFIAKYAVL